MEMTDFINMATKKIPNACFISALTDAYIVDSLNAINQYGIEDGKLLELRIFNGTAEYKAYRSDIGKNFIYRIIEDGEQKAIISVGDRQQEIYDSMDEVQYLDIDTGKRIEKGYVQTTGGGKYHLPLRKITNAKIKIRYYLTGKEEGAARVVDWRVVELMEGI